MLLRAGLWRWFSNVGQLPSSHSYVCVSLFRRHVSVIPVGCRSLVASGHQFLYFESDQSPIVCHCPFIACTFESRCSGFWPSVLTHIIASFRPLVTGSDESEWGHVALPLKCVARVTHGSLKLCLSVTEVNRGECVTFLVSFVPAASDCVLLKQASLLFEAVLCFCWWSFVSAWNQIGAFSCRCFRMFVTVLLVPTNPEHRDHRTVWCYKLGNNSNNNNQFILY